MSYNFQVPSSSKDPAQFFAVRNTGTEGMCSGSDLGDRLGRPPCPPPPPYIQTASPHFGYALLIARGWKHDEACEQLSLNPRTVERWRSNLLKVGRAFFARDVSYETCARYATDEKRNQREWREQFQTPEDQ